MILFPLKLYVLTFHTLSSKLAGLLKNKIEKLTQYSLNTLPFIVTDDPSFIFVEFRVWYHNLAHSILALNLKGLYFMIF